MKLPILASIITSITAFSFPAPKIDTSKMFQAGVVAIAISSSIPISPAFAGDEANGQQLFQVNCISCHANGRNAITREKTLEKDALDRYLTGGRTEDAVVALVTNGKRAMPAFGRRLSQDDIQDVATYVISSSEKGWDVN